MPINAFGGGPGTGKTYGVVEHVILPAIAAGRFIITNIDGLDAGAIYDYVAKNFYKDKIICIGHIRTCSRDAPGENGFFPGDASLDKPNPCPPPTLEVVAGGDLVVIDEATRYWVMGEKVSKEAQFFFREHRHFANEIGHTCDLVVIDPDLMQLARPLRGKIELSSLTHKPKGIGLNRYVVRLYRGCKLTGKPQSVNGPYKFKPEIYALYKSYAHANAKESAIDGRQNIFASKILWYYLIGVISCVSIAIWLLWGFFVPDSPKKAAPATVIQNPLQVSPSLPSHVPTVINNIPPISEKWRVVGTMVSGGLSWVVVSDIDGRLRLESPSSFIGSGSVAVGEIDGSRVSTWSGVPAKKGILK
jgi:zona occludens toxin